MLPGVRFASCSTCAQKAEASSQHPQAICRARKGQGSTANVFFLPTGRESRAAKYFAISGMGRAGMLTPQHGTGSLCTQHTHTHMAHVTSLSVPDGFPSRRCQSQKDLKIFRQMLHVQSMYNTSAPTSPFLFPRKSWPNSCSAVMPQLLLCRNCWLRVLRLAYLLVGESSFLSPFFKKKMFPSYKSSQKS